jgi:hypothetical protein
MLQHWMNNMIGKYRITSQIRTLARRTLWNTFAKEAALVGVVSLEVIRVHLSIIWRRTDTDILIANWSIDS